MLLRSIVSVFLLGEVSNAAAAAINPQQGWQQPAMGLTASSEPLSSQSVQMTDNHWTPWGGYSSTSQVSVDKSTTQLAPQATAISTAYASTFATITTSPSQILMRPTSTSTRSATTMTTMSTSSSPTMTQIIQTSTRFATTMTTISTISSPTLTTISTSSPQISMRTTTTSPTLATTVTTTSASASTSASISASSTTSSSSSSTDYMSIVTKWRTKMGLADLTHSTLLEANALKTVTDSNGQMVHELNPGSYAQVLAPGDADDFEDVYVGGWLCEIPTLPGLDGICVTESVGWSYGGETGHAEILSSTTYTQIGCALAVGIWACDLA